MNLLSTVSSGLKITGATGATVSPNGKTASAGPELVEGELDATPAIAPGDTPAGGFLDLALFGIGPIPVGDESIVNFNVPGFVFGGVTYNQIGVTSNGYAVVGGGVASDVDFLPQTLPDPARPNGVLAPYWTDLDGTGAEGIRAGTLTDGVNTWIVIQWDVLLFGSPAGPGRCRSGSGSTASRTSRTGTPRARSASPHRPGTAHGRRREPVGYRRRRDRRPADVELRDHDDAGCTRRDVHLHADDPRCRQGQPLADDVDDGDHGGRHDHGVDGDRRHQEVGRGGPAVPARAGGRPCAAHDIPSNARRPTVRVVARSRSRRTTVVAFWYMPHGVGARGAATTPRSRARPVSLTRQLA